MANLYKIPLTQGKFALVDKEDFDYLSQFKWCYTSAGYAIRTEYPKGLKGDGVRILMHRLILDAPKNKQVDHINQDGLDNRRSNIRLATPSQNQWNKGVQKNNTSGHKGISWDMKNNKWRVSINTKGRYINLGRYSDIKEAVLVREKFVLSLHGEFGRLS